MPSYSLFGGRLDSELAFPDLESSQDSIPAWVLRVAPASGVRARNECIGARSTSACTTTLWRTCGGFQLQHDCTGQFDVNADGSQIGWYPSPEARLDIARLDVTGRVLSLAMHAGGELCLHGSGVMIGGQAIAFVAAKGSGKSTLAAALVARGRRLISDDTLAITPQSPVMVRPGLHQLRLRTDSSALLSTQPSEQSTADGKRVLKGWHSSQLKTASAPLAAIYVLQPVYAASAASAAQRHRLSAVAGAMALVRHSKLAELLGGSEAQVVFDRSAQVASTVAVYELEVIRNLGRIDDVAHKLGEWHGTDLSISVSE